MFAYTFKRLPEGVRGIVIAVLVYIVTGLVEADLMTVNARFLIGLFVGSLHIALVGLLAVLTKERDAGTEGPPPPPG